MAIDRLAKRWFPVLLSVVIAAVAHFLGLGIGPRLDSFAGGSGNERVSQGPRSQSATETAPIVSAPIAPATKPPRVVAERGELPDPLSWPDCEGVQVTIVSESNDPWWSMTTLREAGESRGRLRRVGDGVAGKQVAFIGFNPKHQVASVWLEGRGAYCQAALLRPPAPAPATSPSSAWKIQRSSDSELRIDRSVVDRTLEDPSAMLRAVRVVPERKDGALVGLRLFGIRPRSLLGTLGLRNGDRLESINGLSIADPEKALQAYARLRAASRLDVRLTRGGKLVELRMNIN